MTKATESLELLAHFLSCPAGRLERGDINERTEGISAAEHPGTRAVSYSQADFDDCCDMDLRNLARSGPSGERGLDWLKDVTLSRPCAKLGP